MIGGNAKIYRVTMDVPPNWANMDVILTGDLTQGVIAMGARIVDSGTVAYFPPEWAVTSLQGEDPCRGSRREKN